MIFLRLGYGQQITSIIHLKFGHECAITFLFYIDKITYYGPSLEVGLATLFVKEAPGGLWYIAHR